MKTKILLPIILVLLVLLTSCTGNVQSNNGKLKLIDGENIHIDGEDHYQLDLDAFKKIGETQECVFVFKNDNNLYANTNVTVTCDENYFKLDYEPTFTTNPDGQSEWKLNITLVDYPKDVDNLPFNINFHTEYDPYSNNPTEPSYNINFNVN